MGGHAAWRLALQAPDKWAAVCIMAGGTRDAPVDLDLARNVSYLPIRIWHGEADGAIPVEEAYIMESELLKYGKDVDLVIVPGQGHGVPIEHEYENRQWLLQYSRKRPDTFSYICNSDLHRGLWGIEMQRDLSFSFTPRFNCTIHNNEVYITSQGTPGIDINLGKDGLELNGNVVVFWNEEKVYCGQVKKITLRQKTQ